MSQRALVTGASGFIGSNVAVHLRDKGWAVWGTHLGQDCKIQGVTARKLDICLPAQVEALLDEVQPAAVFHLAAIAKPDDAARDLPAARQINVQGTKILAEACGRRGVKLVYTSSDMVFAGGEQWLREESPTHPLGVYGRSKLDGEAELLKVEAARGAVLRTSLCYGWGRATGRCFAENWIRSLLTSRPIGCFTDQWRCPIAAEDLVAAMLLAVEKDLRGVFHAVGPERINRLDFGLKLAREFALPESLVRPQSMHDVAFDDPRPGELLLSIDKLKAQGWDPLGVDAGLKRMHETLQTLR
jgi:dTDP-4-dehydrorhamnose reductase